MKNFIPSLQHKVGLVKLVKPILILVLLSACTCEELPEPQVIASLNGSYLGQDAPGFIPELFAPDVFTMEAHSAPVFSPDGRTIYWNTMNCNQIISMTMSGDSWMPASEVSFAMKGGSGDAALSPDGSRLFFTSFHPVEGLKQDKENIWVVEREIDGWGTPSPLDLAVNQYEMHWQHSVAANGNLYFSAPGSHGGKDIYCSQFVRGFYQEAEVLSESINSTNSEGCPYVSPDEDYIIFDRHGGDVGFADLYISFMQANGSWGEAISMDPGINTGVNETCPTVSPNGAYFFFLRNDENEQLKIFWVDASVIEEYRSNSPDHYAEDIEN